MWIHDIICDNCEHIFEVKKGRYRQQYDDKNFTVIKCYW